jgi:DNA invertase Pin-like site-specific DNA recombinase
MPPGTPNCLLTTDTRKAKPPLRCKMPRRAGRLSDVTKVREMKAQGMGASEIAKALRIGRASVYRALGEGTQ